MGIAETFIFKSLNSTNHSIRDNNGYLNSYYNKYIKIDMLNPEMEIPTFCIGDARYALTLNDMRYLYIPINIPQHYETRATSTAVLNSFLRYSYISKVLIKGVYYYGCRGILMDGDRNILLIFTYITSRQDNTLKIKGVKCYISPLVFANSKNPIENLIIKKFIPVCVSDSITIDNYDTRQIALQLRSFNSNFPSNIPIIIDNCSNFVETPSMPNPLSLEERKVNTFIKQHVEDIIL